VADTVLKTNTDIYKKTADGTQTKLVAQGDNFTGDVTGNLTGDVTGDVTGIYTSTTFTVATAPDATTNTGTIIYVSDGDTGSPCIAVSNGTNWLRVALGTAIASS